MSFHRLLRDELYFVGVPRERQLQNKQSRQRTDKRALRHDDTQVVFTKVLRICSGDAKRRTKTFLEITRSGHSIDWHDVISNCFPWRCDMCLTCRYVLVLRKKKKKKKINVVSRKIAASRQLRSSGSTMMRRRLPEERCVMRAYTLSFRRRVRAVWMRESTILSI